MTWLRRLNPYRWIKDSPVTVKVDNPPLNLVLPMQKALVQEKSTRLDGVKTATALSPVISIFLVRSVFDEVVRVIEESCWKTENLDS